jgi:hypothetical protein
MLPGKYSTSLAILLRTPEKGCTPTLADGFFDFQGALAF